MEKKEDNINYSIPWMTAVIPWSNTTRSLEFHFFARKGKVILPKKQELKYFVDFSPHIEMLSDTEFTLMYFHKPVASVELIACDEVAKMSRQHCHGVNSNSVCKSLNYCRPCECSESTDPYAGTSAHDSIYRIQKIKLINRK